MLLHCQLLDSIYWGWMQLHGSFEHLVLQLQQHRRKGTAVTARSCFTLLMFDRFLALVGARPMGWMMAWMSATSMHAMAAASGARLNRCGVTCITTHQLAVTFQRVLCSCTSAVYQACQGVTCITVVNARSVCFVMRPCLLLHHVGCCQPIAHHATLATVACEPMTAPRTQPC